MGERADRAFIEELLARYASVEERIRQALLIALHSRGLASLDEITREARKRAQLATVEVEIPESDNVQVAHRWDQEERRHIQRVTLEYAARELTRDEIEDLVNLTRKREQALSLEEIAGLPEVPHSMLAQKVREFCRLPVGQTTLPEGESISVRLALIRRFVSEQLQFQSLAKKHLWIRDFDDLVDRIVADDHGAGLVGGKAAGMLLGWKILQQAQQADPAAPQIPVRIPESYYLRSDVMEQFLRHNGLRHLADHKYKDLEAIRNDYPLLRDLFKNADFPHEITLRLDAMLERLGPGPLVVRSSSLLEDRFGATFAGKYRSVFVCNSGCRSERLDELLGAIAEVYASSLHPDPMSYRRQHGLLDFDESMAVLIQKTVGRRVGRYFLPAWAGVAFSRNLVRRNPRIRPEDGMARVVFGLGTRAVDRVGSDQPRIIPLGLPALRPEIRDGDVVGAAQQLVDVVDLERCSFVTRPVGDVLAQPGVQPGRALVFSSLQHGVLRPVMGDGLLGDAGELVVTFDGFARSSPYPAFLRWCLQTLEAAYGCPVDIEFAFDGAEFHLLQCRPQAVPRGRERVSVPQDVPPEDQVFSASHDVMGGCVDRIEYVVLIDPRDYDALASDDQRLAVARVVRQLNDALADRRFVLVGPGRWGSRDLRLGVRVTYSDIHHAQMLVEVARSRGGYTPEVSFGSHFFQDLVESDIQYLALYPDEPDAVFDEGLLHGPRNALVDLLPDAADLAGVVRVIHVPAATGGRVLRVDMDERAQFALGYLVA